MRFANSTAVAALVLAAATACSNTPGPPGDILLITVDTLRPDHLGIYGYGRPTSPNLERWMADAAIFERAYAPAAKTPSSVVSALTGLYPWQHRVRLFYQLLADDRRLVSELLPDEYQTAAFVSSTVLTEEALGIAGRFDHYDDFVDEREPAREMFERNARRTTDAVLSWLAHDRDPARPAFVWIHYMDPHGPYAAPDDAGVSFDHETPLPIDTERVREYMRLADVTDGREYVDRYDEEIAYADVHLGRLLDGTAELIDLDRALVVFTADHGESMMDHEHWFRHAYHVYEEIVRVPLVVRAPGAKAGRYKATVSLIDLAPTILSFAGADVGELEGIDLARATPQSDRRVIFTEATFKAQWRAAIRGREKWMVRVQPEGRAVDRRRYYDLDSDPEESTPRDWDDEERVGERLIELCLEDPDPGGHPEFHDHGSRITDPKVSPRADERAVEKLRSLGYVD